MRSKALNLEYRVEGNRVIFEDGVCYTMTEAETLKGRDDKTLLAVHEIKKMFGGKVISRNG